MATETLYIPENDLKIVVKIIRAGLRHTTGVRREVRRGLEGWCREEMDYLKRSGR